MEKNRPTKLFSISFISLVIIFYITVIEGCKNPPKQEYIMESIPTFDLDGNVYLVRRRYDHLPTKKDSIDFERERKEEIRRMIDSVHKIK